MKLSDLRDLVEKTSDLSADTPIVATIDQRLDATILYMGVSGDTILISVEEEEEG